MKNNKSTKDINTNLTQDQDPHFNTINKNSRIMQLVEKSNITSDDFNEIIRIFKENKEIFFAKDEYGRSVLYCLFENDSAQKFNFNFIWEVVLFHEQNDSGFAQKIIESQIKYETNVTNLYHTALNRNFYYNNNKINTNLLKTALDIFSKYDISPDLCDGFETKLIEQAMSSENLEQVKILIERDPDCVNRQNYFKETPMHKLAKLNLKSKETLKSMIKTVIETVPADCKIDLLKNNQGYIPFINSNNTEKYTLLEALKELAQERQEDPDFAMQHPEIDFEQLVEELGQTIYEKQVM